MNPNKITAKMGKIMFSANQIESFIDGQMVTSDSNRSKSDGDYDQIDMSKVGRMEEEGGEFGKVIKDPSNVTGEKGTKLKSRYNHPKPPTKTNDLDIKSKSKNQ